MELQRDECLKCLASATRGYLAMNHNALPAIFAIDLAFDGYDVVFRAGPEGNLPDTLAGNVVCVFVEGDGWNVSVTGTALVEDRWARVNANVVTGLRYSAASVAQ